MGRYDRKIPGIESDEPGLLLVLVGETEVPDRHGVTGTRSRLGERLVDPESLEPTVHVGKRVDIGEIRERNSARHIATGDHKSFI